MNEDLLVDINKAIIEEAERHKKYVGQESKKLKITPDEYNKRLLDNATNRYNLVKEKKQHFNKSELERRLGIIERDLKLKAINKTEHNTLVRQAKKELGKRELNRTLKWMEYEIDFLKTGSRHYLIKNAFETRWYSQRFLKQKRAPAMVLNWYEKSIEKHKKKREKQGKEFNESKMMDILNSNRSLLEKGETGIEHDYPILMDIIGNKIDLFMPQRGDNNTDNDVIKSFKNKKI